MKKIIKNIFVLTVGLFLVQGCDQGADPRFGGDDPRTGWIEFRSSASTTGQSTPTHDLLIDIQVPEYPAGLTLNYEITAVEGDFTQFIPSPTGSLFIDPAEPNRAATPITLELNDMEIGRDFVTIFDVTITSITNGIRAGVDEGSILTHRVTIPCSNPEELPDDYFVGDYMIVDGAATIGPGNGTSNVAPGMVTLFADPENPNVRAFLSPVLPAFLPDPQVFEIEFTTDNVVILANAIETPLSCDGGATGYNWGTADSGNSPWDICNDESITVFYTEDTDGSCGGPFTSSFILTKVN